MFTCCVGDIKQEQGEVVETKQVPVLQEKGTQSADAKETSAASGVFTVTVPAKRHSTLGLELDSAGSGATIVEVKKGAVDDFNQLNPLRTIQPHDMILSIDEAKGKEAIGKKLAQAPLSDMKLTLFRPQRLQVKLRKEAKGSLGIKLLIKEAAKGAVITEVTSAGLVGKWNAQNPSDAVRVSDRLLAINGITELKDTLVQELAAEMELELTVLKY